MAEGQLIQRLHLEKGHAVGFFRDSNGTLTYARYRPWLRPSCRMAAADRGLGNTSATLASRLQLQ